MRLLGLDERQPIDSLLRKDCRFYTRWDALMAAFDTSIRQAAALPMKGGKACIITSSNGKRWVIPKGLIEPGQTAGEAALQEAWEEAGLVGVLEPDPIGSYLYEKWCGACHVIVYRMKVTEVTASWPEDDLRQRVWLSF